MNILSYAQIKYWLNTLNLYRFTHTLHTWGFIYLFIFFEEVSDDYPDELEKTIKNQKHTHSHTNHSTLCLAAVLYLRTGICGGRGVWGGGIDFTQSDHVWLLIWIFLCYCYIFSEPLNFGLSTISIFFFRFLFLSSGWWQQGTCHAFHVELRVCCYGGC